MNRKETELPKQPQEVIAQCPNPKCGKPIYIDHSDTWCYDCGDSLPENIRSQLPKIQKLKIAAATERGKQEISIASQRIDEEMQALDGDYLVIPFIGRIKGGFFSSQNAETVSRQLQSLINWHSQQGWEFHSIAKVDIEVTPGCLASLFGAHTSHITFDQVIFRRARP
jgi:hypothetical protein